MQERAFKGIWIPAEIWLSKDLSIMEKIFLVEIDSLDNDDGCYASNKYFAEFFGVTNGRASQIISKLSEKGYVNIDYEMEGKLIKKRILKVNKTMYPVFNKLNTPIKYSKGGYLENFKDNNIYSNNLNLIKDIVEYLNEKAGTKYHYKTKDTQKHINARLTEGFTLDDFKKVIDIKCDEWLGTDMEKFIRPMTLFGTKFESYLNQKTHKSIEDVPAWYADTKQTEMDQELLDKIKRKQEELRIGG